MKLLLDTHVWLWLNLTPDKLPKQFAEAIADPDNEIVVSVVSVWELSIKARLGKISFGQPWSSFTTSALEGVRLLDVRLDHVERVHGTSTNSSRSIRSYDCCTSAGGRTYAPDG